MLKFEYAFILLYNSPHFYAIGISYEGIVVDSSEDSYSNGIASGVEGIDEVIF
jgi:hypothetical protein